MISAVIVDDEPKAILGLEWELKKYSDHVKVVKTFSDPEEALKYLSISQPDCLFLDIQMPTIDGFSFLEKLGEHEMAVIITTAYNEYAMKALKNEAIDYLLKPIDTDDLHDTLHKVQKHKDRLDNASKLENILTDFNDRLNHKKIVINADGQMYFLNPDTILYAESDGNYCTIFIEQQPKIVVTKKLKEIHSLLPESNFFRIHNSYVVNLNKIRSYVKTDGYVLLSNNQKIPVARQRKSKFLEKL